MRDVTGSPCLCNEELCPKAGVSLVKGGRRLYMILCHLLDTLQCSDTPVISDFVDLSDKFQDNDGHVTSVCLFCILLALSCVEAQEHQPVYDLRPQHV